MWAVRWLCFKKLWSNGFAAWVRPCRQLWVNLFQKSTSWKQWPPQNSLSAAPLQYSQCARHPGNANSCLPGSASCLFLFCSQFHAAQVVHNRSTSLAVGLKKLSFVPGAKGFSSGKPGFSPALWHLHNLSTWSPHPCLVNQLCSCLGSLFTWNRAWERRNDHMTLNGNRKILENRYGDKVLPPNIQGICPWISKSHAHN